MRDLLAQFVTSEGIVERPAAIEGWPRPTLVELRNGDLRYEYEKALRVRPGRGLMEGFLKLATAPDERIAAYARHWGALKTSPQDFDSGEVVEPTAGLSAFDALLHSPVEATEAWKAVSREVGDLLCRAAASGDMPESRRRTEISSLQNHINRSLFSYLVVPGMSWRDGRWSIRMRCRCVGAAVFMQLMLMIAQKDGFGLCRECGAPFEMQGRRRLYCAGCGLAAAWRAASSRLYEKKRRVRLMHRDGRSQEAIADEIGEPIPQIKRWLKKRSARE